LGNGVDPGDRPPAFVGFKCGSLIVRQEIEDKVNTNTLAEHPFVQECFADGLAVDRAIGIKKIHKIKPEYPREPTEYEYYMIGVGASTAQLLEICQDIEDSLIYLGTSGLTTRMRKLGITKHRHIRYALENFIVRSQSLHGRVLFLIDATLHLGSPDDLVSHQLIAGNVHVQVSPLENDLKAIKKLMAKYQYVRNEVIHHRSYDEDDLRLLGMYTIVRKEDEKYALLTKILSRELVAKKRKEYTDFKDKIFGLIHSMFGNLKIEYDKRKKKLA
jgi:hypothetical protein